MLSDSARRAMQYVLDVFGPMECDFCDWKALSVDETELLLTVEVNGRRNKAACPICFHRMYPDFDSRVHNHSVEGNQ